MGSGGTQAGGVCCSVSSMIPTCEDQSYSCHCMRGVGEFLLARYPEIRNSFRELVLSPQYERFRAALHDALNDAEPEIRHGEPWYSYQRSRNGRPGAGDRCPLQIASVSRCLVRVGALLPDTEVRHVCAFVSPVTAAFLPGPARVFALAILVQNGIELDDAQFREFIEGALTTFYGSPIADSVSHSERIQKALLDIADTGKEEAARKARNCCLGNAKEKLDAEITFGVECLPWMEANGVTPNLPWNLHACRTIPNTRRW